MILSIFDIMRILINDYMMILLIPSSLEPYIFAT